MLRSLSVENFAVTKSAHLEFSGGFCALTGETGAGKSMMVDALAATLGARAETLWVRQGCSKATISAVFDASEPAKLWLSSRGIDCQDGEVSLRRAVESEGRSKAWINGVSVSAGELREIGSMLAAIHGQHESVALLGAKAQREHLDAYGKCSALLLQVEALYKEWSLAKERESLAQGQAEEMRKQRAQWAWELDEIGRVAPADGEWAQLEASHVQLSQATEIGKACDEAIDELSESEDAICARLARLAKNLSSFGSPKLTEAALAISQAADAAGDAARDLSRFKDNEDLSVERFEKIEARMGDIHALSRKLRQAPADLWRRSQEARAQLDALEVGLDQAALSTAQKAAKASLEAACARLTQARIAAAEKLSKAATSNLAKLGMSKAKFSIVIEPRAPGVEGADAIEFAMAGHEGAKALPLAKCASGGELARVGLSLCAASLEQDQPGCMVFDEVDAGIGGPTASKVGQMLAKIGAKGQALAVTHLPQVAALADQHYAVGKKEGATGPESVVKMVEGAEREREIARMLGDAKSDSATAHAKALLSTK
jgi:DNA repair protein RecN (Recombination protein N)